MENDFMEINLSNLYKQRQAVSRSLSAENFRGEPGKGGMATTETTLNPGAAHCARELGQGWKLSPCLKLLAGKTVAIMAQDGPGMIRHIWFTLDQRFYRNIVLRVYWDGEETPSVESPIGDFMCCAWNARQVINALAINVNPAGGMNCFFPMPFSKHARITIENQAPVDLDGFFYTVNYTLEPIPADALYLHAQWRRSNPLKYGTDYVMVDGIKGQGQYVGTFMAWQQNNAGWWGEGEIKMFLDGDEQFPTICGTGTEDYFGGAWCFGGESYSSPYMGFQQVVKRSDEAGARMTLYRFHVQDPVFFKTDLRITMQALGWRSEGRYLPLQDDIAAVVYWYQTEPHAPFPALSERNAREII
jgi:hypothetical protein